MSVAIPHLTPGSPSEAAAPEAAEVLEDYVDRLRAPLVGIVPLERRQRFLSEVAAHLEALTEDFQSEGLAATDAAKRAVGEHGNPGKLAEDFLTTWYERGARGPLEKRFGRANCTAFGAFVVVQALYLLVLQVRIFEPNGVYYRLPLSPGQIRQIWPSPLPYPENSPWFLVLIGYPILAPFIAGIWVGRRVPAKAGNAVYHALVPLILCSFTVGVCLLPVTEGILFALFQLVFWLPMGTLAAHISSVLSRAVRVGRTP